MALFLKGLHRKVKDLEERVNTLNVRHETVKESVEKLRQEACNHPLYNREVTEDGERCNLCGKVFFRWWKSNFEEFSRREEIHTEKAAYFHELAETFRLPKGEDK